MGTYHCSNPFFDVAQPKVYPNFHIHTTNPAKFTTFYTEFTFVSQQSKNPLTFGASSRSPLMNRVCILLLFVTQLPTTLLAQIDWGAYSQSFRSGVPDNPAAVGLMLCIRKENNSFWVANESSARFDAVVQDAAFMAIRPHGPVARTTFDTAQAHFFVHGVGPKQAKDYLFRVLEYPGYKVRVPWSVLTRFSDAKLMQQSGLPPMGYIGGYQAPLGNMLIVDLKRKESAVIESTAMVAWESITPVITSIYTSADLDVFLQKLQYPWAKTHPTTTYSLTDLHLPAINSHLVFTLAANIYAKQQVQYQLLRDNKVVRPWQDNEYDNSFIWLKDFSPGRYQLHIRYTAQPNHIRTVAFTVDPAWYQTKLFKLGLGAILALVLGLGLFVYLLVRQQRKTRQEEAKRQKLQLELKALYAQLNPHFVFNALSSIQGLINQQNLQGANQYLADFARLLRESLSHTNREERAVVQECQTIETYLKLEQLRFGFRFSLDVDEQLDPFATNLPLLLWQPILENAVKHGVAHLQQAGTIQVQLTRQGPDLLLHITDNGPGVDPTIPTAGFGISLTQDRIQLLNQLHPNQPIALTFRKVNPTGTSALLTFANWLL